MKNTSSPLFLFFVFILAFLAVFLLLFSFSSISERTQNGSDAPSEPSENVTEPPRKSSVTIVIDAGHGGEDGGAIGVDGVLEKDINLTLAKELFDALTVRGITCVMTRTGDMLLYDRNADYEGRKKALDMKARLEIAEAQSDAIFISIHQNSYPVAKYSGFQIYYSKNNSESAVLAKGIELAVREKLQPDNNRASKEAGSNIYLLQKLTCPALLLECGFLSNPDECARLQDAGYRARLVEVLSDALERYLFEKHGNN
jgi:N-acetylmuramoyl-L-alanine amidase